jgi:hypothetical protein
METENTESLENELENEDYRMKHEISRIKENAGIATRSNMVTDLLKSVVCLNKDVEINDMENYPDLVRAFFSGYRFP